MEDVEDAVGELRVIVERQAEIMEEMQENQQTSTRMAYVSAGLTLILAILTAINVSVAIGLVG